jgi:hypothetical protein
VAREEEAAEQGEGVAWWAGLACLAARGQKAGWAAWPLGRLGQKLKKVSFLIKIEFLNIPRLWKFAHGDLGGIWTQGFFQNSSSLLKYFRKMKYAMPCYATLGKN